MALFFQRTAKSFQRAAKTFELLSVHSNAIAKSKMMTPHWQFHASVEDNKSIEMTIVRKC